MHYEAYAPPLSALARILIAGRLRAEIGRVGQSQKIVIERGTSAAGLFLLVRARAGSADGQQAGQHYGSGNSKLHTA